MSCKVELLKFQSRQVRRFNLAFPPKYVSKLLSLQATRYKHSLGLTSATAEHSEVFEPLDLIGAGTNTCQVAARLKEGWSKLWLMNLLQY